MVKDDAQQPIPGVSVIIKGKTVGSSTDLKGQFSFNTTEKAPFTLVVSYVGFQSQEREIIGNASNLSFDHGVSIDPLIIEQIDVIRGPATLLYGGGAVGGVVNAIDHRIPKEKLQGITGRGEVRYGGANLEQSNAAVVDVGTGNFVMHFDAYNRD